MKFPINLCPVTPEAEQDFARAAELAAKAIAAEYASDAKFFHGLARFYWSRCNASE